MSAFARGEGFRSAAARDGAREPRGDGRERRDPSLSESAQPKLSRRRANKHSKIKSGRTIGERRERLETASERLAARKKVKTRQKLRIIITVLVFLAVAVAVVLLVINFLKARDLHEENTSTTVVEKTYRPTVEVIDEHAGGITSRMSEYIGMAEADFREKGLTISRAVIPVSSIREVDFFLDGHTGYIKATIDRGTGVTAEDAERMLRYLAGQGINEFEYIDVRIDGKAYWK